MRQDSVEFPAKHSFFLSTNPIPIVTDTDHGTWRRLALVRFPYRFRKAHEALETPDDRYGDPGLRDRLRDGQRQREAVLAWLVTGAERWYAGGMSQPPASVTADTAAWRANSDPIEGFWRERLRPAEGWREYFARAFLLSGRPRLATHCVRLHARQRPSRR